MNEQMKSRERKKREQSTEIDDNDVIKQRRKIVQQAEYAHAHAHTHAVTIISI